MENKMNDLKRVESSLAATIIEFAKDQIAAGSPEFHAEQLRTFINERKTAAPSSPTRILQLMRKNGQLNYELVSRSKSLYRIISVSLLHGQVLTNKPEVPVNTSPVASQNLFERIDGAKKLLKQITEFVNIGDRASEIIWDIMTGLRGPDNGNGAVKDRTTARLRYAAGFRTSNINIGELYFTPGFIVDDGVPPKYLTSTLTLTPGTIEHHFAHHYNEAYTGLKKLGLVK
jgi:hypothetical protein